MTATRDDRGRFVSAQEFAANELLKAAVRRAVDIYREPCWSWAADDNDREFVVTMLAESVRGAELLLGEA